MMLILEIAAGVFLGMTVLHIFEAVLKEFLQR
jgi:hypothetical protein